MITKQQYIHLYKKTLEREDILEDKNAELTTEIAGYRVRNTDLDNIAVDCLEKMADMKSSLDQLEKLKSKVNQLEALMDCHERSMVTKNQKIQKLTDYLLMINEYWVKS